MAPPDRPAVVLLTGGGGFVGAALQAAVAARRPEWTVVAPPGPLPGETGRVLDILDVAGLEDWIRDVQPDAVVHLAAVAAVTDSTRDPRTAWNVNLTGTLNLVLALQRHAPAAHLLHMSSAEVYGASANEGVLTERTLLQPLNPYGASKAAADILVRQACAQGLSATVLRPFNQVGPGQSEVFALPAFAAQIARIEAGLQPPVLSVGALDDRRDFLAVDDAVDAYVLALERRAQLGGAVLNICSGRTRRVGELLDELLSLSPAKIAVRIDPARLRPAPSPQIAGDNAHARDLLGWSPERPLRPVLEAVLAEQRQRLRPPTL